MKKFLMGLIATMFLACAGNSDSSKQVADNSQEKAVAESLEQTANEPLKKDSLTKIADDLFYVSFICTAAENTGTYETECQEWTEKKNKLSDEDQEEIIRIGAEKFQVMVEKSGKYDNQRKEEDKVGMFFWREAPTVLPADCLDCSEELKKMVDTVYVWEIKCKNDQPLSQEECADLRIQLTELKDKMSLDDQKKIFEIQFQKLMKVE